jgi:hypothetical protein
MENEKLLFVTILEFTLCTLNEPQNLFEKKIDFEVIDVKNPSLHVL